MSYKEAMFLGFLVTPAFADQLEAVPRALRDNLIGKERSSYLSETIYKGDHYIGKDLSGVFTTASLDLSAAHIYSVLKKVVPNFPYECHSLFLFSFPIPK